MTGVQATNSTAPCNLQSSSDPKTKFMEDIMELAQSSPDAEIKKIAEGVLTADRHRVLYDLNRQNRNQNLYGLLRLGIDAQMPQWNSDDEGARKDLTNWIKTLNRPGVDRYTPAQLKEWIADINHKAGCVEQAVKKSFQQMEIAPTDFTAANALAKAAKEFATGLGKLHDAVSKIPGAPNICVVMNIQPRSH